MLPLTSLRPIDLLVTKLATIGSPNGRATLLETASGVDIATVTSGTESELIIADAVREIPI